jgi:hypothetical protein
VAVVAVFALGMALYAAPTRSAVARSLASRELRTRALEQGERVRAVVPAYRRRLWNYYRATQGLLVATDRRILFIGMPPTIRGSGTREGEPPLIEEVAFSYDDVRPSRGRVFLGEARGVVLHTSRGNATFGVPGSATSALDSLMATIAREQEARRIAAERERAAQAEADRKARAPICHVVRRGDALGLIAQRYASTPEEIQALNGLTSPRIRAGDTLLVRSGDPKDVGGKRCELVAEEDLEDWGFRPSR